LLKRSSSCWVRVGSCFLATPCSTSDIENPRLISLMISPLSVKTPDGQSVLYGAAWNGDPQRIFMTRTDSQESVRLSLPDALDLMVICVEAGQGMNAALVTVGREMQIHAPRLGEELRLISSEIRAGLTRATALRNFASRTGVEEARALCAVLIQSDRLGTSIAQALRVHAQSMRTRRRQRAEENARKTAVKLLFPLIFCIFPALLVVILAPAMIQIVRTLSDTSSPVP